ncbi:MAG: steroid delta-isomerase [Candidatus Kapabacteria bacterium]|nr:steroid delta-isomerase [Candidatus Kapabacteria bacterium]
MAYLCHVTEQTSLSCELLAQAQLDAYNAHDVDAFASVYCDDVQLLDLATGRRFCSGIEELRELYSRKFAEKPSMHCRLVSRIVCPPFVIDEEDVVGLVDGQNVHAVATYECRDGKICRAWFLREVHV